MVDFNGIVNGNIYRKKFGSGDREIPVRVFKTIFNGRYFLRSINITTNESDVVMVDPVQPLFEPVSPREVPNFPFDEEYGIEPAEDIGPVRSLIHSPYLNNLSYEDLEKLIKELEDIFLPM
jgi:hypothetical protein